LVASAILAEGMDRTVRGAKDIYSILETHPIGVVPVVHNTVTRAQARRRFMLYSGALVALAAAVIILSRLPG
jgi:hypothetical protein